MNDRKDLLTLAVIGNYLFAAFSGLFAFFPLIHFVSGLALLFGAFSNGGRDEAIITSLAGLFFVVIALVMIAFFAALAVLSFINARRIAARKTFTFVLIVSAAQCFFMPIGTALGVFTLWLIHQDGVKIQFQD